MMLGLSAIYDNITIGRFALHRDVSARDGKLEIFRFRLLSP